MLLKKAITRVIYMYFAEKVAYGTGDGFTIEEVQLCNVT
jgi:hypothetical protein